MVNVVYAIVPRALVSRAMPCHAMPSIYSAHNILSSKHEFGAFRVGIPRAGRENVQITVLYAYPRLTCDMTHVAGWDGIQTNGSEC